MNVRNPQNSRLSNCQRLLRGIAAPLAAAIMMALPSASFAGVYLSVNIAPPPLPVYEQPPIPGDGYIWTPGYWAYGDDGYFWVPGTWVRAPYAGALWTPGYWDYRNDGAYVFNSGYWGLHIGFYGGVDYGYGYCGEGYQGGYWNRGALFYNTTVNNINITNINVYNRTVINNVTINNTTINNRTSFHGGPGGVAAQRTREDMIADREEHIRPVADQQRHVALASHNSNLLASVNHGAPPIAATQRPAMFNGEGVVRANPGNPNALRSGRLDPRTGDTQPSRADDRAGSMTYPHSAAQVNPNQQRASRAPWTQGAQSGMQQGYGGRLTNPREDRRYEDTAQRMRPEPRDLSAYRREPPQVNYANSTPRYQQARQAAPYYNDRQIERAPRQVASYQPARAPAPMYAPRPQAQPQPRATPRQQQGNPRDNGWRNIP